jgi:hypothetical protein
MYGPACRSDPNSIDADKARAGKSGGGRSRTHHARMPEPFVYALPIQVTRAAL